MTEKQTELCAQDEHTWDIPVFMKNVPLMLRRREQRTFTIHCSTCHTKGELEGDVIISLFKSLTDDDNIEEYLSALVVEAVQEKSNSKQK